MSACAADARAERRPISWTPLVVVGLAAVAAALHLNWSITSDTSWLITAGERLLAGQTLYSEIGETNPPMSIWLYLPWVWLAGRLGASPDHVVILATMLACLAGIAVSERILSGAGLLRRRADWWIVAAFALLVLPMQTFTQREHFAVAFALPMLAAVAARGAGRPASAPWLCVAGLCGGLVMAIKPHFALPLLAALVWAVAARRSLRPLFAVECLVAGAVVVLYGVAAVVLHPEYLSDIAPLAAAVYLPNRAPWQALFDQRGAILAGLCVAAWLLRAPPKEPLSAVLLAATAGFFVVYLVQGRGWDYHVMPALTLAAIGFGMSLTASRSAGAGLARRVAATTAAIVAVSLLALVSAVTVQKRESDEIPYMAGLKEVLRPLGPDLKIAALSMEITLGYPLAPSIGASLVNRGPTLWIAGNALQLCRRDRSEQRRAACDDAVARERAMLREDLLRTPPDVVLVARMDRDWLAWAREDPELATLLDGFRHEAELKGELYDIEVLVRSDRAVKAPAPDAMSAMDRWALRP